MLKHGLITFCTIFVVIAMVAGCGGEFSSLDSQLKVSDMSDDEAATFCEEAEEYMIDELSGTMEEMACIFMASFGFGFSTMAMTANMEGDMEFDMGGGGGADMCQETYDACMSGEFDDMMEEDGDDEAGFEDECPFEEQDRSDCDATVEQIGDCLDEGIEEIEDMVSAFSCSNPEAMYEQEDEGLGPACEAVEEVCPGYLDHGSAM